MGDKRGAGGGSGGNYPFHSPTPKSFKSVGPYARTAHLRITEGPTVHAGSRAAKNASSFVDGKQAIVQRQREQRERRGDRWVEPAPDAAVRLLRFPEPADEERVPLLPGVDVSLEEGLR